MMLSDTSEFIQNLRDQEPESFAALYAAYGRKIYNLAYRMTGNREDAEDITQETFLQVYRKVADFREESQLYTWIYAIAKNLCYRFFQRAKKNTFASIERLIYDAAGTDLPPGITALEKEALICQVKDGCLTGLLRCLSFNQRLAFILHVLLRLPLHDVAGILDKSEAATKVLIHRARKTLRVFLCKNCSVYDPANPCHCANLIGFSLKQGWIDLPSRDEQVVVDPRQIEGEIKRVREVVELYALLAQPHPSQDLARRIQQLVREQEGVIFTRTKV
jgi:RNA polymerase sigma-70 factor (ECF subfamily)